MDKKLGQADNERRKLEQQLMGARSSSFHGSMVSLDSNSDESVGSPSPNPGTSSAEIPQNGEYIVLLVLADEIFKKKKLKNDQH